jgi:predicted RecB family endonuclease
MGGFAPRGRCADRRIADPSNPGVHRAIRHAVCVIWRWLPSAVVHLAISAEVFSMANRDELRQIVEDLIGIMHTQAKEVEKLVEHVQQVAGHLEYQHQFSVIASELSELQVRLKKLARPTKSPAERTKRLRTKS